jgi:hypothetical protein
MHRKFSPSVQLLGLWTIKLLLWHQTPEDTDLCVWHASRPEHTWHLSMTSQSRDVRQRQQYAGCPWRPLPEETRVSHYSDRSACSLLGAWLTLDPEDDGGVVCYGEEQLCPRMCRRKLVDIYLLT